jgi:choline dehydrogenase
MMIHAEAEVILAASTINTPKLLMLSGIGPAEHLRSHGIEVIADRAGVGGNLQDHLEIYMQFQAKQPITLYKYWNLFGKAMIGAQWLFTRKGLGASNQFEACGFIRSDKGVEYPDIQYHFLPIAVRYAWSDNPTCNLFNAADLPASPFRTDNHALNTNP